MENIDSLIAYIKSSVESKELIKITISKARYKSIKLKNIYIKPIEVKDGDKLNFVYRNPTQDITKNFGYEEAISVIEKTMNEEFFQADVFTTKEDFHFISNKKNSCRVIRKAASLKASENNTHDKQKKKYLEIENNVFLRELGITSQEGKIKKDKQDKFRQINKYIEIIDSIVDQSDLGKDFTVVDMGSGKGYLTFALYDYLKNQLKLNPEIIGVEMREELIETTTRIAEKAKFENLKFKQGTIVDAELEKIDMLIALHACNTATDEAIFRGLKAKAGVIICAPCCHKQIRKEMNPKNDLAAITKFGILEERQAELLTDGIRALIMQAHGYKTKVFEFISTEHTPKNVLIVGIKKNKEDILDLDKLKQIENIKKTFGIRYHHLEKLLKLNGQ